MPPSYLSARDFARRLSISPAMVTALVQRGEVKAIRVGRLVRIPLSEVERFEREAEVRPERVRSNR